MNMTFISSREMKEMYISLVATFISSHEVKKLYMSGETHEIFIFSLHEMKEKSYS